MLETAERGVGHVHFFVSPRSYFLLPSCVSIMSDSHGKTTVVKHFLSAWPHSEYFDRSKNAEICVFAASFRDYDMKMLEHVLPHCHNPGE